MKGINQSSLLLQEQPSTVFITDHNTGLVFNSTRTDIIALIRTILVTISYSTGCTMGYMNI